MYNYSIMPLNIDHLEEICQDIKRQYEEGISTLALFMMALVPEGDPAIDKAAIFCEKYDKFRDRLAEMGLECGILAQCTIGHGYPLNNMYGFQSNIGMTDGNRINVCCPYDEGFRAHFFKQFATLASHKPKVIMVDDDFRLMARGGRGCACPLHMARVRELVGMPDLTREQMRDAILVDDNDTMRTAFVQTQREALLGAAEVYRAGIDSVDPSIQGAFCICSESTNVEFGYDIGKIMAGKGNKTIIRIHNARYCTPTNHNFTAMMLRAAREIRMMRGADVLLAESDTCPHNRYSTSANALNSHFTGSILEGVSGAKHWLTRTGSYEPKSGEAYRRVLGKNAGFHQTLSDLVPKLKWRGCRIPFNATERFMTIPGQSSDNGWMSCVLERLGLPMYFSPDNGGALFLDGTADNMYSDAEMLEMFKGSMFISSETAARLVERGFGEYIGVSVRPWEGKNPSGEMFCGTDRICSRQMKMKEIVPNDGADVKVHSVIYHIPDGKTKEPIFPGCVSFKNKLGGTVVTFCGTPKASFIYTEAFAFLTESRKKQIADLLAECGENPVYYTGDVEMYFRAADIEGCEGEMLIALFNLGLDPIDEIDLKAEREIVRIEKLMPNGEFAEVSFAPNAEGGVTVAASAGVMDPVVMKVCLK